MTSLSIGARLILYDGSPFQPDIQTFLKFVNDQGLVFFFSQEAILF